MATLVGDCIVTGEKIEALHAGHMRSNDQRV